MIGICKHQWKEISRTYAEPQSSGLEIQGRGRKVLEKIIFGVTTILWECQKCQELRREELLGKEIK